MRKSFIPQIITFTNLSLGIISIISCIKNNILISSLCILIAALIDRYDGKVARKIDAVSLLGKELDSLSDLVSFGVAPAILSWNYSLFKIGFLSYAVLLIFPICGAFRLARFNITEFNDKYIGMPITVAGSISAIDSLSSLRIGIHPSLSAILMSLLSYLMVSKIKIKKI